jgi:hypothetical protein
VILWLTQFGCYGRRNTLSGVFAHGFTSHGVCGFYVTDTAAELPGVSEFAAVWDPARLIAFSQRRSCRRRLSVGLRTRMLRRVGECTRFEVTATFYGQWLP